MPTSSLENQVLRSVLCSLAANTGDCFVPVAISGRHIHLTGKDVDKLFGFGYRLTPLRYLSQPGQFACRETLIVNGGKGTIKNVRILGPVREKTQVELSMTDCITLGVSPHIRQSGDTDGTGCTELVGTHGSVILKEGVIVAARHLHFSKEQANAFRLMDGEAVCLEKEGDRPTVFGGFLVRVSDKYEIEAHVDTDEANAANIKNGDLLRLYRGRDT